MTASASHEPYLMRLEDLMNTYVPVYPRDGIWQDTVEYLTTNRAENAIVEELMRQYARDGRFREPLRLETYGENDPAEDDNNPLRVADGTHRVVASYLMKAEYILVQDDHPTLWEYDPDAPWTYTTTVVNTQGLREQLEDSLFDILRSFALDDDTWVTASIMTGGGSYLNICWDNEPTPEFEARYPEINARIISVLRSYGATLSENEVITITETGTP